MGLLVGTIVWIVLGLAALYYVTKHVGERS